MGLQSLRYETIRRVGGLIYLVHFTEGLYPTLKGRITGRSTRGAYGSVFMGSLDTRWAETSDHSHIRS